MKIGILTFHRARNYGAFLQSYALKSYLLSIGVNAFIVDYWPKGHEEMYKLFSLRKILNRLFKPLSLIRYIKFSVLTFNEARIRKTKMDALVTKYLGVHSDVMFSSKKDLSKVEADILFYGSDQIWWKSDMETYKGFDEVYWGEYVNSKIKKVSYAASMGCLNFSCKDIEFIKEHLKKFSDISVREQSVCELLTPLTSYKIKVVIDPVFLMPRSFWEEKCKKKVCSYNYVLFYNLLPTKEGRKLAEFLSVKYNCKVIEVTGQVVIDPTHEKYQTADALELVSLIKNADFVVSSSFHGVAFSLLFEKQFYSIGLGGLAGRVQSLLSLTGLSDRVLKFAEQYSSLSLIDYNSVNPKLRKIIDSSKEFINKSIL